MVMLNNEFQDDALRPCVHVYIREHKVLPFIACCIALFGACFERVLEGFMAETESDADLTPEHYDLAPFSGRHKMAA